MSTLLREDFFAAGVDVITEGTGDTKSYKLKGIMLQADVKNKNGRTYPKPLLESVIKKYTETKIAKKHSMGELEHRNAPDIKLERVSHLIESLVMDGANGIGTAKLLETPCGKIAITLVQQGIPLGMSTRCIGNTDASGVVNSDLDLIGVDIVNDPSAPSAFCEAVLENKEWIMGGDGNWMEKPIQVMKEALDKKYNPETAAKAMFEYLDAIKQHYEIKRLV